MSIRAACPGCMSGHHDQHVRDWNIRPGLIGGAWCDCPGDPECTWKFEEFAKRMLRDVGLPTTDEPTTERKSVEALLKPIALRFGREYNADSPSAMAQDITEHLAAALADDQGDER